MRPLRTRLRFALVATLAAGALALLAVAAASPARSPAASSPPPAAAGPPPDFRLDGDAERGAALFAKRCAVCHGAGGDGTGTLAPTLDPPPGDLTDASVMGRRSDWEVYLVIRDGGPAIGLSPKMAGWGKISTDQQIRDLAAFVRTLAPPPGGREFP